MFAYGDEPYDGVSNKEVLQMLKRGDVLACPPSCPQIIYEQLILPCFNLDPSKRPSYKELYKRLSNIEEFLQGQSPKPAPKKQPIIYNTPPIDDHIYKDASEDIGVHM
jgi:serine/threonine protein kinase